MNNFAFYSPTFFVFGNENGGTMGGFVVLQEKDMENIYRRMLRIDCATKSCGISKHSWWKDRRETGILSLSNT